MVVAASTLAMLMVYTAPLAAIGAIADSTGAGVDGRSWILSSMSIGLAAALLSAGAVADDFGRRRSMVAGLGLLGLACAVCALAVDPATFVAARVVQGLGAAMVTAAGLGVIAHAHPPGPDRARAAGLWGAGLGAGIALGPLLAAASVMWSSWRLAYLLLALLCLGLAALATATVPESRSHEPKGVDLPGMALLGSGVTAALAGLVIGRQGWTEPTAVILLGTGAALMAGFFTHERLTSRPMLEPALWRVPAFRVATTAAFVVGTGPIALFSYLNGFTEMALGYSAMDNALMLLLWSVTGVVFSLLARRLPPAVTARWQFIAGLVALSVALTTMVGIDQDSTWMRFAPGLLLAGVASGVLNSALGREAVASVPEGRGAMGSGANNTSRYVGAAVGVTVVSVVVASHGTSPARLLAGWNVAALICAAGCALGALVAALDRRDPQPVRSGRQAPTSRAIGPLTAESRAPIDNNTLSSIPWAMKSRTCSSVHPVRCSVVKMSPIRARASAPIWGSSPAAKPCIITRSRSWSWSSSAYAIPIRSWSASLSGSNGPASRISPKSESIRLQATSRTARKSSSLLPKMRTT